MNMIHGTLLVDGGADDNAAAQTAAVPAVRAATESHEVTEDAETAARGAEVAGLVRRLVAGAVLTVHRRRPTEWRDVLTARGKLIRAQQEGYVLAFGCGAAVNDDDGSARRNGSPAQPTQPAMRPDTPSW